MLTALDFSAADARRGMVARSLGSRVTGVELRDLRGHLTSTTDEMRGRMDPGGLLYAAEAAAGRLAARRRDLAA
jgi:hypothetical protein